MSEPHHAGPIEDNLNSHPGKVAIAVLIGAIAVIIGLILLAQFAIDFYGVRSHKGDENMSEQRVAERIAPVAQLAIDPNAPATPAPAPAAPATPTATVSVPAAPAVAQAGASQATSGAGKKTFDSVCTACHSTGALGAPKFGDKAAWAPRIAQGKDTLYNAALHGLRAMPAKGGNPSLSDADVKAAVDYMVAAAK